MEVNVSILQCHGLHGGSIRSTCEPIFARAIYGWTTCSIGFHPPSEKKEDLCPLCSVRIFVYGTLELLFGLPSIKWAMDNRNDPDSKKALFVWDLLPDEVETWIEVEKTMFDRCEAWCYR